MQAYLMLNVEKFPAYLVLGTQNKYFGPRVVKFFEKINLVDAKLNPQIPKSRTL